MKTLLLLIIGSLAATISIAQVIKPEEAPGMVGKTVTVCGEIFSGKYLENAKTSPTLLNMGASFPKQPITIVIPKDVRQQYGFKPEELLLHKHICVTGKIVTYQNSVQIVIKDKSQLKIL